MSPHRLMPEIRVPYLMAIADSDDRKQSDAKLILRAAIARAYRAAEIEVYPGTGHGGCVPDWRAYDPAQAKNARVPPLVLLQRALA